MIFVFKYLEIRIQFLNNKILKSCPFGYHNSLHKLQRIYISSVSVKLRVIREISLFNLTFFDRMSLLTTLTSNNFLKYKNYFYLYSERFFSLYFSFPNIYIRCIQSIFNLLLLPLVDFQSDRSSFGFRPYRYSLDLFIQIKRYVLSNFILSFSTFEISTNNSIPWLCKNLLLNKRYISYIFISKFHLDQTHPLYFTLLNSSLNGLL